MEPILCSSFVNKQTLFYVWLIFMFFYETLDVGIEIFQTNTKWYNNENIFRDQRWFENYKIIYKEKN